MSTYHYFGKQQWVCRLCMKTLSSKRSFEEHMNIHNKSRPFGCDECKYAAGNHVPRSHWGYQCPYCGEFYMEPASYQQHITHWGLSATFGCPYTNCDFTSKSSRYFREHMRRHQAVFRCNSNRDESFNFNLDNLSLFLVNDESGVGAGSNLFKRINRSHNVRRDLYGIHRKNNKVVHRFIYSNAVRDFREDEEKDDVIQRVINVEKLLDEEDLVENSRSCALKPLSNSKPVRFRPYSPSELEQETSHSEELISNNLTNSLDWIETEVIIDDEMSRFSKLPDGQIDDFGLD